MPRVFLLLAFVCLACLPAFGAPISMKEIEFHLRQKTPEAQLLAEIQQRRLLTPLDDTGEASLRKHGASEDLIAKLKSGQFALSPQEAAAELRRREMQAARLQQSVAGDAAAAAAMAKKQREIAERVRNASKVREMLRGRLVRMEGDQVREMPDREIDDIRIFGFYYSAHWSAPGRALTPQLVDAYKQIKAKYPQFELIFVSRDRDEFNWKEYMKSSGMPWPAVRFKADTEQINQWAGETIPWLVAVSDSGAALTKNGVTKQFIQPAEIIESIVYLLGELDKPQPELPQR